MLSGAVQEERGEGGPGRPGSAPGFVDGSGVDENLRGLRAVAERGSPLRREPGNRAARLSG
ncbi:MAG TPA: hypothetical protein DEP35_22235 [Deltaproteobacteria bacterium]|nr:hypothetical protein [Deltaproteobacteria bacterium]